MIENLQLLNKITKKKISMDMKTSSYLIESVDFGQISANHVTNKYYNQIGVTETNTTIGTRAFQLIGWIIGDTQYELESKKSVINSFVNPLQLITATVTRYDGVLYSIDISPDSSVIYGVTREENNEVFCKFSISGVCNDPLFSSSVKNKSTMASTIPLFHFPLVIPETTGLVLSKKETSLIKSVYNYGSVSVGIIIELYAEGTVTNPSLTNIGTQEILKLNKVLSAGEKVTIDTSIGIKSAIGTLYGVDSDYFQYLDLNSDWLMLAVGDNVFRYNADSNVDQLSVNLYYDTKLLEVQ